MKTRIEIWGGFHSQLNPVRIMVDQEWIDDGGQFGLFHEYGVSDRTVRKVERHMCGIKGCCCGPHNGWQWDTVESKGVANDTK